jgi:hypothetical protein
VVLDVDPRHGGDETLRDLVARHGPLPDTPTVLTSDGGCHFYFARPAGEKVHGRDVGPGVQLKADGGYVVAPPSIHPSGWRYSWEVGRSPDDLPLAPLPSWLLETRGNGDGRRDWDWDGHLIPEGRRHTHLVSLAGKLRAIGLSVEAIEAALLRENKRRCQPPLPEREVQAIARSVGAYPPFPNVPAIAQQGGPDGRGVYAFNALMRKSCMSESWPPPAAREAFYGLAGEVVNAIQPHTEADPHALLASLLVAVGNAIGRGAYFRVGQQRHYVNLFVCLVGATSRGRKGLSWDEVRGIMALADPEWAGKRVMGGLSSGEGLLYQVRDPRFKKEPIRERGRVVSYQEVMVDEGVEDKRLMVVETEFGRTLAVIGREGNTLSAILRQAWDTGDLRVLTKMPLTATEAHISVLAHITEEELLRLLDRTEMANGFGNRFLWLLVHRFQELPEPTPPEPEVLAGLAQRLGEAIEFGREAGELRRSPEAAAVWREVYGPLTADRPGLFGALTARAEAQVMRLACIYAVLDRSPLVQAAHLKAALALWEYVEASVRHIWGDALGDPVADTILRALRQHGELSQSAIYGGLLHRNLRAERIAQALGRLLELGLVEMEERRDGPGRPATVWRARVTQ